MVKDEEMFNPATKRGLFPYLSMDKRSLAVATSHSAKRRSDPVQEPQHSRRVPDVGGVCLGQLFFEQSLANENFVSVLQLSCDQKITRATVE